MRLGHSIMCWLVLLGFSVITTPLYAQINDNSQQPQSLQQVPPPQQTSPAQQSPQVQQQAPQVPQQQYAQPVQTQQVGTSQENYFRGKVDGEREGKSVSSSLWILAGCIGTPIWAYIIDPQAPSSMAMMGKPMEYIQGYNEGYKKSVKGNNIKNSWIGCALGVVTCCVLNLIGNLASAP